MIAILAVLPIFVVLTVGHVMRRSGFPTESFWPAADRLVYWVLVPALLFNMNARVDLSIETLTGFGVTLIGGYVAAVAFALIAASSFQLNPATSTSVLQGAARHNTFIALAICESLLGPEGLALGVVAATVLALATNLTIVPMMILIVARGNGQSIGRAIRNDMLRNPLIIGILSGLLSNILFGGPPPIFDEITGVLGAAALPLMLLCVGSALQFNELGNRRLELFLASLAKFGVFPLAVWLISMALKLPDTERLILLVFSSVPTAIAGQTQARAIGGDVSLMSATISLQTVGSFLVIPLLLMILL
ncbi:MAG: AEC family transporter [Pararhodobacter sp.]|nr:AEC family transporter [Pararhodobacter sp.]